MNNPSMSGDDRYYLLKVAHEQFGRAPGELSSDQLQQAGRIVGQQLRIEDAVLRSREASGVVIPVEQVEDAWAQIVARYEDAEAMRRALADQGLDPTGLRAALARELKVEAILERICAGLPAISDTDVSLYYFSHIERFIRPETRKARHILVTINDDFPENARDAARTRIEGLASELRGRPERFAERAMKHSECPTSLQGGMLGEVKTGTLYPELDACLFELEPGELSNVVESPMGFHLMLCEQVTPATQVPLDEVLPRLRDSLQARQRKVRQREWLESLLRQNAPVENLAHA